MNQHPKSCTCTECFNRVLNDIATANNKENMIPPTVFYTGNFKEILFKYLKYRSVFYKSVMLRVVETDVLTGSITIFFNGRIIDVHWQSIEMTYTPDTINWLMNYIENEKKRQDKLNK